MEVSDKADLLSSSSAHHWSPLKWVVEALAEDAAILEEVLVFVQLSV